jgi:hypothetical protein
MTDDITPEPGKWYVSFPTIFGKDAPPAAGPFDTEQEAVRWAATKAAVAGGLVWRCQEPADP